MELKQQVGELLEGELLLNELILQIIFVAGILYGLITFFIAMTKKGKKEISKLTLSISIVVSCAAAIIMTIN